MDDASELSSLSSKELVPPGALRPLDDADREIDGSDGFADRDRFGFGDIVDELAQLCILVSPGHNIALFAPWGAGKTSVGRLLKQELKDKPPESLRFTAFDASRFADQSLRPRMVEEVAGQLGLDRAKLQESLYGSRSWTQVRPRPRDALTLGVWYLGCVTWLVALGLIAALVAAAVSVGPFEDAWRDIVNTFLLAVVLAPAVAAGMLTLVAKALTAERTEPAPTTDEQFERLFRKVVKMAQTDKIVVFVDELDRRPAHEVVGTLDVLRTFLGSKQCLFVVAADQQVLEQALRQRLDQATPENTTNPHYSAGGSYLDKVFDYQVALPPLRIDRFPRYALELLDGATGIWERVSKPEVVSVLVPPHITSPRRVKLLLNAFALTFRLLARRDAQEQLAGDLNARAREVAKLVCLRCEFPLFAADLQAEHRLPELVLRGLKEPELPGVDADVAQRALAYARADLPVAELLTGDGADSDSTHRARAAQLQHSQQLIRYLEMTRGIPGPRPDIIHAQTASATGSLGADVCEALEQAATDGDWPVTAELIDKVAPGRRNADQARAVLRQIAPAMRRSSHHEARRAMQTLLSAAVKCDHALDEETAQVLVSALSPHLDDAALRHPDRWALLRLGILTGERQFLAKVLEDPETMTDRHVAELALHHAVELVPRWAPQLAALAAGDLAAHGSLLRHTLLGREQRMLWVEGPAPPEPPIPEPNPEQWLNEARPPLPEPLALDLLHALAQALEDLDTPERTIAPLVDIARRLDEAGRHAEVAMVVQLALAGAGDDPDVLGEPLLAGLELLAPIADPRLANAVLATLPTMPIANWPAVAALVDADAFSPERTRVRQWARGAQVLLEAAERDEDNDYSLVAAAALPPALRHELASCMTLHGRGLGEAVQDSKSARARLRVLDLVLELDRGAQHLIERFGPSAAGTLRRRIAPKDADAVGEYVERIYVALAPDGRATVAWLAPWELERVEWIAAERRERIAALLDR